jgi:hypothetical protein
MNIILILCVKLVVDRVPASLDSQELAPVNTRVFIQHIPAKLPYLVGCAIRCPEGMLLVTRYIERN